MHFKKLQPFSKTRDNKGQTVCVTGATGYCDFNSEWFNFGLSFSDLSRKALGAAKICKQEAKETG